jgi:hypothetical protein
MRLTSFASAAAALVMASGSTAAADWNGAEWDRDANAALERDEVDAGLSEARVYERMDARADGVLDSDEFYGGVFDIWDDDDDLGVSEDEFGASGAEWYGEVEEHSDFDAWDANADGVIGEDEFGARAGGSGLYEAWGGADGLAEDEFHGGLYETADVDGDGVIGSEEGGWLDRF